MRLTFRIEIVKSFFSKGVDIYNEMCYTLYVRKKGVGFEMTFTIKYRNEIETIDIETLDELAYIFEKYGYRKMAIDMNTMEIEIIDNETEEK